MVEHLTKDLGRVQDCDHVPGTTPSVRPALPAFKKALDKRQDATRGAEGTFPEAANTVAR